MSAHLAGLAETALQRLGDHDALVFEGRTWRSGELAGRARRAGGGLVRAGVAPGDRVVVVMSNCPEVIVSYQAVWRAGAVVTPVVFLVTSTELAHVFDDAEATTVLTSAESLAKVVAAARSAPTVRLIVLAGDAATRPEGLGGAVAVMSFAELEDGAEVDIVARADDELAALMYTGGTTGRSKGVMLSHGNLNACATSAHAASHQPGVVRALNPLPVSHAYGMIVTVTGWLAREPGLTVLQRWFDPVGFLDLAARHRIQRAAVVPAMIPSLLAQPLEDTDLSELRIIGCGGAPLAVGVLRELERRLPQVSVLEGYGCTESGAVISTNPPAARRVGTVGLPIPGYEVRIVDDTGAAVPTGTDGEITVRSAGVMLGYWRSPDATAATLVDGWLHTGDIGRFDEDGYLSVVDRKKDLIIRNGFNVYPRDVEDVLLGHPAVALAGVVGRPDPGVGEEVVAFVSLHPGASAQPAELVDWCRERVSATKYPREVRILTTLPLTSVGKLDRKALRREARGEQSARK